MKTEGIGIEGFKKIFDLKDGVKKEIENYKNQKTMIHLQFTNSSKEKNVYKKLQIPSLNKIIIIDENDLLGFEYTNKKFSYKNEITEKIILSSEEKELEFLINVKRHHDNYYNFFINIEKDNTYSLEVVFFYKDIKDSFGNIQVNNTKIMTKEIFPKTIRYNLINISLNTCIQLFDSYSDNKINELDEAQQKELFSENNLFFNFIYGNKKKIGKIFCVKQEKDIEDFTDDEKKILKEINAIVSDEKIYSSVLKEDFKALRESQNYTDQNGNIIGNYLIDLNEKFKKIPFFLKYYDKVPTNEDIEIIKALAILNIILYFNQEEWARYLKIYIRETKYIFKNKDYLNNKDKIMILINYLTIVRSRPDYNDYTFESFYELNEESFFIKSELYYREIISKLTEDSSLFLLYLQLDSGSDIDYITLNHFYKIKHISLTEIQYDLLAENFYPYFFTFHSDKDLMAWNDIRSQIKNYNINVKIFSENDEESSESNILINNTVKLAFIKFHEYAHTKFKGDYKLGISPRYLLIDNLNYLDNKKIKLDMNQLSNEEIAEFLGESGQALERYIFGDEAIVNNIIYSKGKNLSQLYDSKLFIQKDFNELHKLIEDFKPNFKKEKGNEENQQSRLGTGSTIYIPKLNIKKDGKVRIYHYYDLDINSADLMV